MAQKMIRCRTTRCKLRRAWGCWRRLHRGWGGGGCQQEARRAGSQLLSPDSCKCGRAAHNNMQACYNAGCALQVHHEARLTQCPHHSKAAQLPVGTPKSCGKAEAAAAVLRAAFWTFTSKCKAVCVLGPRGEELGLVRSVSVKAITVMAAASCSFRPSHAPPPHAKTSPEPKRCTPSCIQYATRAICPLHCPIPRVFRGGVGPSALRSAGLRLTARSLRSLPMNSWNGRSQP